MKPLDLEKFDGGADVADLIDQRLSRQIDRLSARTLPCDAARLPRPQVAGGCDARLDRRSSRFKCAWLIASQSRQLNLSRTV
ncbi:hypothetical protein GCM10010869_59110 [Mesorhizobium tianshanense]|nr:hypothetical protein GCM10010869_59110 [Mesorhizobium tianshanense]